MIGGIFFYILTLKAGVFLRLNRLCMRLRYLPPKSPASATAPEPATFPGPGLAAACRNKTSAAAKAGNTTADRSAAKHKSHSFPVTLLYSAACKKVRILKKNEIF
jgi:hypothetical protein